MGGSPLLGVRGTLIITHGSAKRRMAWYAVDTAARAVRERVAERISESLGLSEQAPDAPGSADALDMVEAG